MKRSSSMSDSDNTRFGRCDYDDDTNRPHKRPRYSQTTIHNNLTEDDADSSTKTNTFETKSITSNNNFPQSKLWVVTSFLGKGSYGSVHLAKTTTLGQEESLPSEIAIKTVELSQASRLKNEARFLERLRGSSYIVSYYGHVFTEDKNNDKKLLYNTVIEYCEAQCLEKHIKAHKGIGLGERVARKVAINVLIGLKHIHGENIIHGDIKPKNILHNGVCAKISGLGKAVEKGSIEYGEGWGHRRGTRRFMSPELMGDMVLDYCADVWAFGCTVLEMLTGERVWGEHGELDDWEDWISLIGESGQVPYVPNNLSEEVKDFLSKCLERDPKQRWTVDSLLKHPFIAEEYVCPDDVEEEEEEEMVAVEEERYEEEVGDGYLEAYVEGEEYGEDIEAFLEEEGEYGEDIEAYLAYGEPFVEVEEAIEIDEEYPNEDM